MLMCCQCKIDAMCFPSLDALEVHLVKEHFNNCFIYECPVCAYAHFPTEKTLIEHCEQVHKNNSRMEFKQSMNANKMKSRSEISACLCKCVSQSMQRQHQGVFQQQAYVLPQQQPTTKQEPITVEDAN